MNLNVKYVGSGRIHILQNNSKGDNHDGVFFRHASRKLNIIKFANDLY